MSDARDGCGDVHASRGAVRSGPAGRTRLRQAVPMPAGRLLALAWVR